MDYKNGQIYAIRNHIDNDIYVGSTCQALSKRMAKHRGDVNSTAKGHRILYTKMKSLGTEQFYIELLESCPCENKEQLRKLEGKYIRDIGTLNKMIAGRSDKEYKHEDRIENPGKYYLRNKLFREANKEKIKEQKQRYCNQEHVKARAQAYRDEHKEEMKLYITNYNKVNKDIIQEKKRIYNRMKKEQTTES